MTPRPFRRLKGCDCHDDDRPDPPPSPPPVRPLADGWLRPNPDTERPTP